MRQHLTKKGITIQDLRVTGKGLKSTCAGCQCLSGVTIEVKVARKDLGKLHTTLFRRYVWAYYLVPSCPATWYAGFNAAKTTQNLRLYLSRKGVRTKAVQQRGYMHLHCEGCQCPTGELLEILVHEDDLPGAKAEGFVLLTR